MFLFLIFQDIVCHRDTDPPFKSQGTLMMQRKEGTNRQQRDLVLIRTRTSSINYPGEDRECKRKNSMRFSLKIVFLSRIFPFLWVALSFLGGPQNPTPVS